MRNLCLFKQILGHSGWVAPSAPPIPLDGYPDLPPPTYNQAISADEGDLIYSNILKLYSKTVFQLLRKISL